jgi:hypothetical protein
MPRLSPIGYVRMALERRAATMGKPQRKGIIVDFVAVRRLLFETTFVPLFLGVLALASALEDSGAGLWQDFLKYVGAFLIALTSSRHYSALELRERSTERTSRPS